MISSQVQIGAFNYTSQLNESPSPCGFFTTDLKKKLKIKKYLTSCGELLLPNPVVISGIPGLTLDTKLHAIGHARSKVRDFPAAAMHELHWSSA